MTWLACHACGDPRCHGLSCLLPKPRQTSQLGQHIRLAKCARCKRQSFGKYVCHGCAVEGARRFLSEESGEQREERERQQLRETVMADLVRVALEAARFTDSHGHVRVFDGAKAMAALHAAAEAYRKAHEVRP